MIRALPPYHPDEQWYRHTVMRGRYYFVGAAQREVLFASTTDLEAAVRDDWRIWREGVKDPGRLAGGGYRDIVPIDNPRLPPSFRWAEVSR